MKTFTEDEKIIARNIDKEYKWMARDRDGNLYVYEGKPKKEESSWYSDGCSLFFQFNHLFSAIKWKDEEPTLISDIYNPRVLDYTELKYLRTILKPFHEEVDYIVKIPNDVIDDEGYNLGYLFIQLYDGMLEFPDFHFEEMYCGMEPNRRYSLNELGITYEEEKS